MEPTRVVDAGGRSNRSPQSFFRSITPESPETPQENDFFNVETNERRFGASCWVLLRRLHSDSSSEVFAAG